MMPASIDVRLTPDGFGWDADVSVTNGGSTSKHRVKLQQDTYRLLTEERCSPEDLLRASFEFLLEQEPKEAILREFDLPVIGRYFPEYEAELKRRLANV
jgi:hypothetical protein